MTVQHQSPSMFLSGVKQGCVLAPTLFSIFFSMLLYFAFRHSNEGVHLHNRSEGKLFNLARLKAKTKVRIVLIKEMLFADDAALISHTEEGLPAADQQVRPCLQRIWACQSASRRPTSWARTSLLYPRSTSMAR